MQEFICSTNLVSNAIIINLKSYKLCASRLQQVNCTRAEA